MAFRLSLGPKGDIDFSVCAAFYLLGQSGNFQAPYLQNWKKSPMLNSVPHSAASGWSGLRALLGYGSNWACIGPELIEEVGGGP